MSDLAPVRVRIAPSPTGDPHMGTAYIALFNYVFAKRHGGKFILRIEDTDQTRSTRQSEEAILRSLRWIGLEWDEGPDKGGPHGPYRQSERRDIYSAHAAQLIAAGRAYRCFCTAERLETVREEQRARNESPRYDRHCRDLDPAVAAARAAAGEPHVVRLAMPTEGETAFTCPLRGEVRYPNEQIDDQVLLKTDGFPTYHLANVVDDHLMGITHVIRAEEWIPSTPKHVILYAAFGWQPPVFIHMPLLRNTDRSKISKRKNPTSLDYYRRAGYLPAAMLNFLANMGYSYDPEQEKFTLQEMIATFDIGKVSLGGPVFDVAKLQWLNGLYLRELDEATLASTVVAEYLSPTAIRALVPLVRERMRTLADFVALTDYFFTGEIVYEPAALLPKNTTPAAAHQALAALADRIDAIVDWNHTTIEAALRDYAREAGWKAGTLFMIVRVAVTGRSAAPPLFETMAALGKPICQFRFREAVTAVARLLA